MNDNQTGRGSLAALIFPERHGIRGRFSVCLFIVILAVCGWMVHRRLSQYETPPQAVRQSTAIKACLTKRIPIPVPPMHGVDAFAVFFLTSAFLARLGSLGNSEASMALRLQRDRWERRSSAESRPSLAHFFFLPPPLLSPVL